MGTHDDQVDGMSGAMTALTFQDRVQSVLPRSMVQLCVDAYRKYEREIVRIIASDQEKSWRSHLDSLPVFAGAG